MRVETAASARYGDAQRFVPVVVGEFPHLVPHYPIFFSKDAQTGGFYCGAMLGIDEGENLFLTEGRSFDAYRPLNLQRGPFYHGGQRHRHRPGSPAGRRRAGRRCSRRRASRRPI